MLYPGWIETQYPFLPSSTQTDTFHSLAAPYFPKISKKLSNNILFPENVQKAIKQCFISRKCPKSYRTIFYFPKISKKLSNSVLFPENIPKECCLHTVKCTAFFGRLIRLCSIVTKSFSAPEIWYASNLYLKNRFVCGPF